MGVLKPIDHNGLYLYIAPLSYTGVVVVKSTCARVSK